MVPIPDDIVRTADRDGNVSLKPQCALAMFRRQPIAGLHKLRDEMISALKALWKGRRAAALRPAFS
jgi:hypothetical protein